MIDWLYILKEKMMMNILSFLTLLLLTNIGCKGLKIETKEEFIRFTERVKKGNTFLGATVLLMNDLDMEHSSSFIGSDADFELFKGTFDGQGYVISNLNISSSMASVSLFGSTLDAELKNIVIDKSCAINYEITQTQKMIVGGIVGFFSAEEKDSIIENCACMAQITFSGISSNSYLFIGGIIGYSVGISERILIKNSAFLGTINLNENMANIYVGGITGGVSGDVIRARIVNCNNAGSIVLKGNSFSNYAAIGGIAGYSYRCNISNCASGGVIKFNSNNIASIGEAVGSTRSTKIEYYYTNWNIDFTVEYDNSTEISFLCKYDSDYKLNTNVTIDSYQSDSLINALNSYVNKFKIYNYQRWALNKENHTFYSITRKTGGDKIGISTSKLILLSNLADRKYFHFDGWYTNEAMTVPFTQNEIHNDTYIYGSWGKWEKYYTISFAYAGVPPIIGLFGDEVSLPSGLTNGTHLLGGWIDPHGDFAPWSFSVPSHNITLRPIWINTELSTPEDIKIFSDAVNWGADCEGLTITLTNDVDMEGVELSPIGRSGRPFSGTFEGSGYVIRNMNITSNWRDVGFIGNSMGMTLRNLVLDSSCIIESTYSPIIEKNHGISTGSFVSFCYSSYKECVAENLIGLNTVRSSKKLKERETIRLGGIVGYFHAQSYSTTVVNCVSHGTLEFVGGGVDAYLGGVIGKCFGVLHSSSACEVINCLADGFINAINISAGYLDIGGISGYTSANSAIRNSIWTGRFEHPKSNDECFVSVGLAVGFMERSLLESFYCDEDAEYYAWGTRINGETPNNNTYDDDFNLKELSSVGSYMGYSLINSLIAFALREKYLSRWTLNLRNTSVSYVMVEESRNKELFTLTSRIALLPEFADTPERHFSGWYSDPNFTSPYLVNAFFVPTILYGRWENITEKYFAIIAVTEKKTLTKVIYSGSRVLPHLQKPKRDGYKFINWADMYGKIVGKDYCMPNQSVRFKALWLKEKISTPQDLIDFSDAINTGANSTGLTIILEKDIDMEGIDTFKPIGSNYNGFSGVFEGQGHRISNLKIRTDSTTQHTGLFGVSFSGAEIRNVILDPTCSIVSSHNVTCTYIGGILGYCLTNNRECKIVNAINFASITGNADSGANSINIGGIVGHCKNSNFSCIINNCANYGTIRITGIYRETYLGGIVGVCSGVFMKNIAVIANNLNAGMISHEKKALEGNWVGIGGIIGLSGNYINVSGCVNLGEIYDPQVDSYTGSITGNTGELAISDGSIDNDKIFVIRNNFWCEEQFYGDFSGFNPEIQNNYTLSDGTSLLSRLEKTTADNFLTQTNWKKKMSTYKAAWLLNEGMHNVTFRLSNKKRNVISYSSKIILMPTMMESPKYYYKGWAHDKNIKHLVKTSVIDKDTILYARWNEYENILILIIHVFGVFSGVLLAGIIIAVAIYCKGYKKRVKMIKKIKGMLDPKNYDVEDIEGSLNEDEWRFPKEYVRPKMEDALKKADIDEDTACKIVKSCYDKAYELSKEGKLPKNVTVDDAAGIAMYTYDLGPENYEMNPFRLINKTLLSMNANEMDKVKDILYLVMTALRKLPVVYGIKLYRGIRADVSSVMENGRQFKVLDRIADTLKSDDYKDNEIITWKTLSSTSPNMNAIKAFLGSGEKQGMAAGTMFIIENGWGYDIKQYSLFPDESEILLEPERQFRVESVLPSELTVIKLRMLKSPIVLPKVFGVHKIRVPILYFIKKFDDGFYKRRNRNKRRRKELPDNEDINADLLPERGVNYDY